MHWQSEVAYCRTLSHIFKQVAFHPLLLHLFRLKLHPFSPLDLLSFLYFLKINDHSELRFLTFSDIVDSHLALIWCNGSGLILGSCWSSWGKGKLLTCQTDTEHQMVVLNPCACNTISITFKGQAYRFCLRQRKILERSPGSAAIKHHTPKVG